MFYVYKIENLINKKLYFGYTNNPKVRWKTHQANSNKTDPAQQKLIHKSIKKYGIENFSFTIIGFSENHESILNSEKFLIKHHKTNVYKYGNDFGYNLTDGGDTVYGMKHSIATKNKMSQSQTGRKHSAETRKKISLSNTGKYHGPPSQETLDKIIKALRANPSRLGAILTQETKDKIGKSNSGKIHTKEHNLKISNSLKKTGAKIGEKHHNAKLTEANVKEIKILLSQGEIQEKIAKQYGVSRPTISEIKTGKKWKHIT